MLKWKDAHFRFRRRPRGDSDVDDCRSSGRRNKVQAVEHLGGLGFNINSVYPVYWEGNDVPKPATLRFMYRYAATQA